MDDEQELKDLTNQAIDDKINNVTKMNRAQRRAMVKKHGKKALNEHTEMVSEAAKMIIYSKIIERLRKYREEHPLDATEDGETDL